MQSPMLLEGDAVVEPGWCTRALEATRDARARLAKDPRPWLDWVAGHRRSERLGHYFETLVAYWLSELLRAPRFHWAVPVREDRVTRGEFDFLFDDPFDGAPTHWEVAVKFYLRDADGLYYGPRGKDRLDLKLERLLKHQLCLGASRRGAAVLTELGFSQPRSRLFVKGILFYHRSGERGLSPPARVSSSHARGWWLRAGELALMQRLAPHARWQVLEKPYWLSAETPGPEIEPAALEGLDRPVMLLERDAAGVARSRGFIVPDRWPASP